MCLHLNVNTIESP